MQPAGQSSKRTVTVNPFEGVHILANVEINVKVGNASQVALGCDWSVR